MNCLRIILATGFLMPCAAAPQDDPLDPIAAKLPAELRSVTWSADQSIRIVIFQGGFEHVTTPVYVQWLAPAEPRVEPTVLASKRLAELDYYSCSDPVFTYRADGIAATLTATHTYERTEVRVLVRPGKVGEVDVEIRARSN